PGLSRNGAGRREERGFRRRARGDRPEGRQGRGQVEARAGGRARRAARGGRPMTLAHPGYEAPLWRRWLTGGFWSLERAFERARAAGKAEDDTRIRIFFVLALFAFAFASLAIGATRAAVFSGLDQGGGYRSAATARADLVDRNG